MAEENTTSVPETDQSTTETISSEDSLDSMLAGLPGLDKYFGDPNSEKPAPTEDAASADVTVEETPAVEPAPAVEGAEEKEEAEKEPAVSAGVQKRIDKLVAQKHEATERAESLAAKVAELEAKVGQIAPVAPTADSPLADIDTVQALDTRLSQAQRVKLWALENLDGGEVEDGRGGTYMMPGDQVKKLLSQSEALLTQHGPDRRNYLATRSKFEQEAKAFYPDLYKTGTEYNNVLNEWVRIFPEVRRFPDFQIIIADALAGQKIRLARKSANGKIAANGSRNTPTLAAPQPSSGNKVSQKSVLTQNLLNRIANDRSALDMFSESLIGKGS